MPLPLFSYYHVQEKKTLKYFRTCSMYVISSSLQVHTVCPYLPHSVSKGRDRPMKMCSIGTCMYVCMCCFILYYQHFITVQWDYNYSNNDNVHHNGLDLRQLLTSNDVWLGNNTIIVTILSFGLIVVLIDDYSDVVSLQLNFFLQSNMIYDFESGECKNTLLWLPVGVL